MSSAERHAPLLTIQEYLASEATSSVRREYLNGMVYAMSGGSVRHSALGTNLLIALGTRLRGKRCRPYNSDMLVRVQRGPDERFYYPDAMVVCEPRPLDEYYQDRPIVIFEVLSESTVRTDLGEKRDAYLRIPSLRVYVVVDSQRTVVTAFRPHLEGFDAVEVSALTDLLLLPEIECEIPLAEIYEGTI